MILGHTLQIRFQQLVMVRLDGALENGVAVAVVDLVFGVVGVEQGLRELGISSARNIVHRGDFFGIALLVEEGFESGLAHG